MHVDNCFSLSGPCLKSSSNIHLIKCHGSIVMVGPNKRAGSGLRMYTLIYSVWLKCQVRERLKVLSPDIETGFQIFRRLFKEILAKLEGCAPKPAKEEVAQRPWKGHQGHEFQCNGAKCIILCIGPWFEAATVANQTREPVRNEGERSFPAFKFRNELDKEKTSWEQDNLDFKSQNNFILFGTQFLDNWVQAKPQTVVPALAGVHGWEVNESICNDLDSTSFCKSWHWLAQAQHSQTDPTRT